MTLNLSASLGVLKLVVETVIQPVLQQIDNISVPYSSVCLLTGGDGTNHTVFRGFSDSNTWHIADSLSNTELSTDQLVQPFLYRCPICEELFEDAVICACCKSTFCGSCLPNGTHRAATLVAAEEGQPPRLLRDETMRRAVACLPRYCRFAFVAETATNSWKRVSVLY